MRRPYDLATRRAYLEPDFDDAEYDRRLATVRAGLARRNLDALVVYCGPASYADVRWLTNLQPVHGSAFAVIRHDRDIVVTMDGMLHGEPMHSMAWTCRAADLRCALGPVYGGAPEEAATLAADALRDLTTVGLGGSASIPQNLYAALVARLPKLRPADAVLAEARMIKSPPEIAVMEQASRIADKAFEALRARLAPGVTEAECAAAAVEAMRREGAAEAFPTCVVGGALAGLKHAPARPRPLERGEMVFLDLGAHHRGYASDTSRCTVVGGRPSLEQAALLSVARELYEAGLAEIRPGRTSDDVARALTKVVAGTRWREHFYETGFGHGIGMDLFEAPGGLFAGSLAEFAPGMTLAYEPMVIVEGIGTGVIEDTLLITETGHRLLTDSPRDL